MKLVTDTVKAFARNEWIYYYYTKIRCNLQKYMDVSFEATLILDNGLWLGGISSASNREALHEHNIETIISVVLGSVASFPYDFNYERADLRDTEDEDIISEFYRIVPIIHEELSKGKSILVHCIWGKSRSASFVCAYLIKHFKMSTDESLEFVKAKRSQVFPNPSYVRQLRQYEGEMRLEREIATRITRKEISLIFYLVMS
jgi:protein tyrosine phosphatase